jgi:hypothetical protein
VSRSSLSGDLERFWAGRTKSLQAVFDEFSAVQVRWPCFRPSWGLL